jgi:hypothetical protein
MDMGGARLKRQGGIGTKGQFDEGFGCGAGAGGWVWRCWPDAEKAEAAEQEAAPQRAPSASSSQSAGD